MGDQVLPANAAKAGLPIPVVVGTPDSVNTGVSELDRMLYGVRWMMDNPVPEELATFAGAHSVLTKVICTDTDSGASDGANFGCWSYTYYPVECDWYDDGDFTASDMCCACGGGSTEPG